MPTLPSAVKTLIIGGGVIGASTLYHLAKRGQSDALLLEQDAFFGTGATGRCAGGVRAQFATAINIQLSKLSLEMFEQFEAETGQPPDYVPCGYLFVLTKPENVAHFERNVALQHSLGIETEWLTGDEVRARLPGFNFPDALAGTFYGRDGLADPNSIVMGYITAARRLGAKALNDITVTGLVREGDRIVGVETNAGTIMAEQVVCAAGPWSNKIGEMAGLPIPVDPIRRQWFSTSAVPNLPADLPFVVDFANALYFHREGHGLLTGMSNLAETAGFDQNVDEDFEFEHMEAAMHRLPALEQAGLASRLAGLYEVTPDHHPIISATPLAGFYVSAGYSGHGFMHGPAAGLLMAEILLDGQASTIDVSQLDFNRFAENRLIKEHVVI